MIRAIGVKSYFKEHAPKSGQSEGACERAVDALLKNDVNTMRELAEKNEMWVFRLFLGEREELDEECHDLVRDMQNKYLVEVQKTELLSAGANGIEMYFREHAPKTGLTSRAIRALRRAGIETMYELCVTTEEELKKVRDLGAKGREFILPLREHYAIENGVAVRENK